MKSLHSASSTVSPVRMKGGEALRIPVRAGTGVRVLAGSLRVCAPVRWMADTMVSPVHHLEEGQWLQLEDGGWIEVQATGLGDVQLLLVGPAQPLAWLWQRLRAMLRGGRLQQVLE